MGLDKCVQEIQGHFLHPLFPAVSTGYQTIFQAMAVCISIIMIIYPLQGFDESAEIRIDQRIPVPL